jgi:hypothetical protein
VIAGRLFNDIGPDVRHVQAGREAVIEQVSITAATAATTCPWNSTLSLARIS